MSQEEFDQLPEKITVRLIRRRVRRLGRPGKVTVNLVTTLMDRQKYPAEEIVKLAGMRWEAETNLRHLKISLKLDVPRCKSLAGVLTELAVVVLVYNLVRAVNATGVGIGFVATKSFYTLQAVPVPQDVGVDIQHVIEFVIRQMNFEQSHFAVDGIYEADLAGQ
jgi:hypothetical protein